eukprot:CAMPEP_0170159126 /NCGR_PEP_ID=MMETSP0033_2-20121228/69979_1 /TAXON_ID=195969 /ORGANISM="Dolichomastix tenuilepis, Strain CCMP3274" /LENGTH=132 /DNA_ID=CAMNT_0010396593 /DNA_START=42 /DNA_END=437 /DNA_ORIENTATION=+
MSLPGILYPWIEEVLGTDKKREKHHFVDGGWLCNYPIFAFDGTFLSLKPENSFLSSLSSFDNGMSLADSRLRRGRVGRFSANLNTKSLGFQVISGVGGFGSEPEAIWRKDAYELPALPDTMLGRKAAALDSE